jgi:hypothetical protein
MLLPLVLLLLVLLLQAWPSAATHVCSACCTAKASQCCGMA